MFGTTSSFSPNVVVVITIASPVQDVMRILFSVIVIQKVLLVGSLLLWGDFNMKLFVLLLK